MKISFTKMHGCGNDYVYVNGATEPVPQEKKSELAVKVSDRHFGIGSDGLIFINPVDDPSIDFEMEIVNGDRVEGHCIKVQVKSSDKLTVGKRNGHAKVGGIKQSTLCYWAELSYNVPVIAIAVDVKKETIYITEPIFWQAISLIDATEK